jgi:aerotaxis receptor
VKNNQPVSQVERPFPRGKYLVSRTDLKGAITYANDAFIELSGFSREELIGRNHNVVRHPDMPPAAFGHLWATVGAGHPWRGIVKNRAKNGDHYWVDALVVPIRKNDRTVGYMSVRSEPSREQIRQAETLYAELARTRAAIPLAGAIRRFGIRARLIAVGALVALLMAGGGLIGISGLALTNRDLHQAYEERLDPSLSVARMIQLMSDNQRQIMLALQHAPDSPFLKMHDHGVDVHIQATLTNRQEIESLRSTLDKRAMPAEEKALADAFFAAREAYSREGTAAARDAIKAGNYSNANMLLLTQMNQLHQKVMAAGDAWQAYLRNEGRKDYLAADERFSRIRLLATAGTLIGLGIVGLVGFLLTRAIMKPLNQAIDHFDRISQGDLTDEIDISGRDEPGSLLCALASMQVHLKVILDEIRLAAVSIDRQSQLLNEEMDQVGRQSLAQKDRVQSTAAATQEFSQSVAEVAESANQTAAAAQHARALVADSTDNMARSMDATTRVVAAVQESSAAVGELSNAIVRIGDITMVIKEIADQTNLLALNAAIEAARAGEFGRGFAVVADEVRKLAERTTSSTAEIAASVGQFQMVTHNAVDSMNRAVAEVENGIGMMRSSVSGLDSVRASSDEASGMAGHIAQAARQQAQASEEVASNMEQVSALIERNTAAAAEARLTAARLADAAGTLQAVVDGFRISR